METVTLSTYSTLKEISQLFKTDPTTIARWSKSGQFPKPIKIGRSVRYKTADIKAFLEQQAQEIN